MRAAAKIAGIGVVNHGLRGGIHVPPPAEQSILRGVKRPVSSIAASQTAEVAPFQKESAETMDDWEFAGGIEEEVVGGGEPIGRIVFGGLPTKEEAKQATDDLKDALESFLSSPRSASSCASFSSDHVSGSGLELVSSSHHFQSKSCIIIDPKACPEPKYALQAFKLLSENPAAQSVVASIACDPNVWNAVLQNDALTEYLNSQRTDGGDDDQYVTDAESIRIIEDLSGENNGNSLSDFVEKVRSTVAEMMNNVTDYVQKIFGSFRNPSEGKEDGGSFFNVDKGAPYIFSLAIMVIAIVLLKR